ncbi:MAG: sigma-70 family RNA polymerase sigma factor [Candidatus Solibacter usitatus]|nr:sigma-70 family RNA polymerase sigma factor [Candidatus Solibacter usitatus]
MHQLSDEELIARSRSEGAPPRPDPHLEELFSRHQRRVAGWCMRYTENREDALDLAQEVLANTFRRLDTFQGNSKFTTWLYIICRNHCLNAVKAKAARPDTVGEEMLSFLADPSNGPMEEKISRDRLLALARGWICTLLEETERRVFVMHFVEEVPLDAITRALRLQNASGAKAYVVSARRKLSEAARRWRLQHEAG